MGIYSVKSMIASFQEVSGWKKPKMVYNVHVLFQNVNIIFR